MFMNWYNLRSFDKFNELFEKFDHCWAQRLEKIETSSLKFQYSNNFKFITKDARFLQIRAIIIQ